MRDVNILKTCVVHMTRPYSTGTPLFYRFSYPQRLFNFLNYILFRVVLCSTVLKISGLDLLDSNRKR